MLAPDAAPAAEAADAPLPPSGALRRFAERAGRRTEAEQERCDFCAEPLPVLHRHLLEVEAQEVKCVCQACRILFDRQAASAGRYRLIPERVRRLDGFALNPTEWERLRIPVGIAFLIRRSSSADGQAVAFYPGPMGVAEGAALSADEWSALAARDPALTAMETDVEALLLYRARSAPAAAPEFYVVPVDDCYRLAGLIRLHWRGLSGGPAVWREVERYFESLRGRCGSGAGAAERERT